MLRSILIVNGSASRRQTSRELLERAGYDVREILSLERAIGVARRAPPLAVVIESPPDVAIPARFAERLRRHPSTQDVPVLVLTRESVAVAAIGEAARVTWLEEPCPPRTLLEEVAYLTRPQVDAGNAFGMVPDPPPAR
jgi:DNA-binding response OmpR family regulator